jgi:hypothetical protein
MERAWSARDDWESIGKAAREAVRGMVPRDPVASFVEKLIGHAAAQPTARRSA